MSKKTFVITVPHATCIDTPHHRIMHTCDYIASAVANDLANNLMCGKSKVFYGDINRSVVDLNRRESRNTEFRKIVRKHFKDEVIVVDIHSYPPYSFNYGDYDIALISSNEKIKKTLKSELERNGYKVGTFEPSNIDDILTEASEHGITDSVLIEVNEKYKGDTNKIAKILAKSLCEVI